MVRFRLENTVIPLFFGLGATALAVGINKETAKEGIEAGKTYLLVPTGVVVGYLWDKAASWLERKTYFPESNKPPRH